MLSLMKGPLHLQETENLRTFVQEGHSMRNILGHSILFSIKNLVV